ncbi:MAG: helix-turn-helix domain-containing protein [Candidatus Methylomirabilota bacterium]|jgi:excisionase family DNA binding protein
MAPVKLYRPSTGAALLDVKPPTLRKWIAEGKVRVVRLSSRAIRIPETEIRIQQEGLVHPGGKVPELVV